LQASAKAGFVGGIADWFAITALFRHPLGLPIPHTAIIPANKDRIADSMAAFLRANFLTPQVVARRLYRFDAAGVLGGYLANSGTIVPGRIGDSLTSLVADVLETLDPDKVGRPVKTLLKGQIDRIDLAPLLGQIRAAHAGHRRPVAPRRHTARSQRACAPGHDPRSRGRADALDAA
jgi:uncharacterized membrane-anchored protein YjiN (DUF445 family)